ncbi:glycosyltransferase [Marinomonas pollencensis]|nr:glycosyltransferase [Marinomonas pollencensis]
MRIAVVVNSLKMGGMERVACSLSDAFAKQGHDTHLIYFKDRKVEIKPSNSEVKLHLFNLQKWVLWSGIGCVWMILCRLLNIFFRKSFSIFFAYAEARAFAYKLKKLEQKTGQFDLIIFRGQGTFTHVWPLKDKRFVFVCESTQNKEHFGKSSRHMYSLLFSERRMVCVSEGAKRTLVDLLDSFSISCTSVLTISNPNDYAHILRESVTLTPDVSYHEKPYILGLGRLVPGKNFPLLIDAYCFARQHYGLKQDLVLVGEGKEKEKIKSKIKALGLEECVFLKGQQSNPFPWYKQADLFVLSSKSEGLGMVLIEALACGTRVVATNCPGGVGDIMLGSLSGFLAEQTPESLAQKMMLALEQAPTPNLEADIAKALEQFDEEYIAKKYCDAYLT